MLAEVASGLIVLIAGMLIGGLIQWARSETPRALESQQVERLVKAVGSLETRTTKNETDINRMGKKFEIKFARVYGKLGIVAERTGTFPRISGENEEITGEQESV